MKPYDKIEEYNSFGPWIYLIDEKSAMPPLFSAHCPEAEDAEIMIKIPRKIERRNANPDMHLYDRVIGIMDDYLFSLTRVGDDVRRETLVLEDIRAIQNTRDLLGGHLQLCLDDGVFSIEYNTVSGEIISQIVSMIRDRWNYKKTEFSLPALPCRVEALGFWYFNLVDGIQREEKDSGLIAYQPHMSINADGFWDFLSRFKRKRVFQNTAFLSNKRELITICQSSFIQSSNHTEYAYSYIYVPLGIIRSAKIAPHPRTATLRQFEYAISGYQFSTSIGDESEGIDDLCKELNRMSLQ